MKYCQHRDQRGFSLTEVMVGMAILTVTIVASTSLLIGLIQANKFNTSALKAYYLAQEGLELVRNMRDSNWMNQREWPPDLEELDGFQLEEGFLRNIGIVEFIGGEFCESNECVTVTSTVRFPQGSKERTVELSTVLTNWRSDTL